MDKSSHLIALTMKFLRHLCHGQAIISYCVLHCPWSKLTCHLSPVHRPYIMISIPHNLHQPLPSLPGPLTPLCISPFYTSPLCICPPSSSPLRRPPPTQPSSSLPSSVNFFGLSIFVARASSRSSMALMSTWPIPLASDRKSPDAVSVMLDNLLLNSCEI